MRLDFVPSLDDTHAAQRVHHDLLRELHRLMDHPRLRDEMAEDAFPQAALDALRRIGVLTAPLPRSAGGLGWGTEAGAAVTLSRALRDIGRCSLSLGRVFEGHVNAIRLLHRHADPGLFRRAATDVRAGQLLGLWVTSFADPVRHTRSADQVLLKGILDVCSAAGHAGRAVILTEDESGAASLAYVDTDHAELLPARKLHMQGMRGTATTAMRFALHVPADALFGAAGAYLREPDFSAGAWRTSAVTVGGLEALVGEAMQQLVGRRRADDPHQQARLGQMLMARETALLWLHAAAIRAEAIDPDPGETVAFVNLARLAIEESCLRVIPLVQRSLGLACLQQGNPAERLMRDLSTYLRQPAGDDVLSVATAWFISAEAAVEGRA